MSIKSAPKNAENLLFYALPLGHSPLGFGRPTKRRAGKVSVLLWADNLARTRAEAGRKQAALLAEAPREQSEPMKQANPGHGRYSPLPVQIHPMTTKTKILIIGVLAVTGLTAQAQSAAAASPPPPSAFDEFVKDVKNPTDWLTWGGDFRARNEYFNNALTLSQDDAASLNEQDVIRFRARLWANARVMTNLSVNARLSAEPRQWMKNSFAAWKENADSSGVQRGTGLEWRYGILDNLNVQWKQPFGHEPLSLTVGRQDILLGDFYDWWLVADGTPGDGSWSFFLDAARVTYELKDIKTRLDLIGIYHSPQPDAWLPTLDYSKNYSLTEQRESGLVLYGSNKSIENMQIDGYFIYKHDDQVWANKGDNADIYTVGAKITGTPAEHWKYSVEGAYQFGSKGDSIRTSLASAAEYGPRTIDAYGGKAKLTYMFKDKMNNELSLVGEFLSGDDPDTEGTDEMFDLLWGRWPRWSELYIYSYPLETSGKIAQINNIGRFGLAWSVNPVKKLTFSAMYNALFAPQEVPTRTVAPGLFSGDGNFRGHYAQLVLKYQFNKYLNAHLWAESVWEGDYYNQRDQMSFLRGEVMLTF